MIHIKKTILTLALLIAATTQAWADYTVTWEGTKLQSINVSKGYMTNATTETMNVDGITVTANNGFLYYGGSTMHFDSGEADGIVFSAENNIKSIAITSTSSSRFIPGGSFQDGGSHTYELNPAAKSYGFGKGVVIDGVTKIVITLESPVTFTRGTGDKANTWTMDGGMPAGNVIVNAEYYQDAAFAMSSDATPVALAPTANNSAKANTDDPLVTGGEVANIVEGTEALEAKQGTLMYYFDKTKATTLMTAAQLEELPANAWSEDVPTADGLRFDAATDIYVYYYIKGADDVTGLADGVKHTFSDSNPVCLTVNVQPEPTYKVVLNAEGLTTEEAANWKAAKGTDDPAAFPLTGVKKDDNVTVTYTGSRKVIGLKAEKKGPTVVDLSTLSENIYQVTEDVILTGTPASDFLIVSKNEYVVTLDNVNPEGSKDVYISGLGKPVYIKLKGTSRLKKIYSYEVPIEGNVSIDEAESGGTLILSSYGSPLSSLSSVIINGGTVKARCTNTNVGNAIWTDLIVNGGAVYLEGGGSENAVSDTITAGSGVTLYGWNGSAWDSTNTSSKYVTTDNTSGDPTAWTW